LGKKSGGGGNTKKTKNNQKMQNVSDLVAKPNGSRMIKTKCYEPVNDRVWEITTNPNSLQDQKETGEKSSDGKINVLGPARRRPRRQINSICVTKLDPTHQGGSRKPAVE